MFKIVATCVVAAGGVAAVGAAVFCCAVWVLVEGAVGRVAVDILGSNPTVTGIIVSVAAGAICLASSAGFVLWLIKCPRDRVAAIAKNVLSEAVRMKISL